MTTDGRISVIGARCMCITPGTSWRPAHPAETDRLLLDFLGQLP